MSLTVCLAPANTVAYPNGGGHLWVYLHWALALKALGCRVIWLEGLDVDDSDTSPAGRRRRRGGAASDCVAALKTRLAPYGLADALTLYAINGATVPDDVAQGCPDLDAAAGADVLLNLWHSAPPRVVERFRRSAFIDTDPGLLQIWMTTGAVHLAPHDVYFTIGETVGTRVARFPDCGLRWLYTPPPIFLPEWPQVPELSSHTAPYTTVAHWWGGTFEFNGITFSCAKPAYISLETAWVSDRTLCYLASGKPAVVQYTGASRLLPDAEGLFRFRTIDEAVRALAAAEADYEHHGRAARALVEEHFDARRVVARVLEQALGHEARTAA